MATAITFSKPLGTALGYGFVGLCAMLLGCVFPLACRLGARNGQRVGIGVSWLYFANIVGSTAGPLLTGFVLMDFLPIDRLSLLISLLAMLAAMLSWLVALAETGRKTRVVFLTAAAVAVAILLQGTLYGGLLERLSYKSGTMRGASMRRSSIACLSPKGRGVSTRRFKTGAGSLRWTR